MKIIPVLDIRGGVAVHAIKGERQEYKPLKSVLGSSVNPFDIAMTFKRIGFTELYLADLDGITKRHPDLRLINQISGIKGFQIMVDTGVSDLESAEELLQNQVSKVVIGTETLCNTGFVEKAVCHFGSDHIIVSLDVKGGKLFGNYGFADLSEPFELINEFQKMGVEQLIVLDLTRVGSREGVDMPFLRRVLEDSNFEIFVGGGIRNLSDLIELKRIGVAGVLLATALHSGSITIDELERPGFTL